jgi:hypothetical protein
MFYAALAGHIHALHACAVQYAPMLRTHVLHSHAYFHTVRSRFYIRIYSSKQIAAVVNKLVLVD